MKSVTVEVEVRGRKPLHPKDAVLAIEQFVAQMCESLGRDPAEGTFLTLVTAVHLAMIHSEKSAKQLTDLLSDSLGGAIISADDWFSTD